MRLNSHDRPICRLPRLRPITLAKVTTPGPDAVAKKDGHATKRRATPGARTSDERRYLRRRAEQELTMTFHADGIEAERAHNALTNLYLKACIGCEIGRTAECSNCPLQIICEDLQADAACRYDPPENF